MSSFMVRPRFLCENFVEAQSNNIESPSTTPPEITLRTNDVVSQDLKGLLANDPRARFPAPAPSEVMKNGLTRMKKETKPATGPEEKDKKRVESKEEPIQPQEEEESNS